MPRPRTLPYRSHLIGSCQLFCQGRGRDGRPREPFWLGLVLGTTASHVRVRERLTDSEGWVPWSRWVEPGELDEPGSSPGGPA